MFSIYQGRFSKAKSSGKVYSKQSIQKAVNDHRAKQRKFNAKDDFVVHDFRTKKGLVSGMVIEKIGPLPVKGKLEDGNTVRRHPSSYTYL